MVKDDKFVEFGWEVIRKGQGEIGMHLHAWNSPPIKPLTSDDHYYHPFLIEYPEDILTEKVHVMTDVLEETFQVKMLSHRAGRWSINSTYIKALEKEGYVVDCSVTPHVSWQATLGNPSACGGTDFSSFPEYAYFVDPDNISCKGSSRLLEVPTTIFPINYGLLARSCKKILSTSSIGSRIGNRFLPSVIWLRPNGRNKEQMIHILRHALNNKHDYVEFMLHSSEFMPGGSPTFKSEKSVEKLYSDLEEVFSFTSNCFEGMTLTEYYQRFCSVHNNSRG